MRYNPAGFASLRQFDRLMGLAAIHVNRCTDKQTPMSMFHSSSAAETGSAFRYGFVAVALAMLMSSRLVADDWPQWLGPRRDSVWRESGLIASIPKTGLPVLWRVPIAGGYSGPAVAGNRVFVTDFVRESGELANNPGGRNELTGKERVLCLDAATGQELWQYAYDCSYNISYASGPRATPTVQDGRVFVLGAMGNFAALDAETGRVLWTKDFKQDYQAPTPIWGFCGHPLVVEDTVYALVGGEGSVAVAFNAETGEEKWRALSAKDQGYCPPTLIEAGGVRQLLVWHAESLNSLNPQTGESYWSVPLEPDFGMSICVPRLEGDLLFASGIRNVGAVLRLATDRPAADVLWRGDTTTGVYCANSTPVIDGGVVYGTDCNSGGLRAVELESGERLWETFEPTTGDRRASHGTAFLVQHQDLYYLFNEKGDLIQARLSRDGYQELGRFHVLDPTNEAFGRPVVWSHPAFANRCLFARNDRELVCVSLAAGQ
jgi:outer membrane protein assembly factor BamB